MRELAKTLKIICRYVFFAFAGLVIFLSLGSVAVFVLDNTPEEQELYKECMHKCVANGNSETDCSLTACS